MLSAARTEQKQIRCQRLPKKSVLPQAVCTISIAETPIPGRPINRGKTNGSRDALPLYLHTAGDCKVLVVSRSPQNLLICGELMTQGKAM
jgi:hypothetical protein